MGNELAQAAAGLLPSAIASAPDATTLCPKADKPLCEALVLTTLIRPVDSDATLLLSLLSNRHLVCRTDHPTSFATIENF